jgi:hypothetical protein
VHPEVAAEECRELVAVGDPDRYVVERFSVDLFSSS